MSKLRIYEYLVGKGKVFRPQDINPLNAGAALPFVFLADRYLKEDGRIALVLPKTALESSAYFLLRVMLLTNYHIEYIVLSSEKNNPNFSYSTGFSEILLVARKKILWGLVETTHTLGFLDKPFLPFSSFLLKCLPGAS